MDEILTGVVVDETGLTLAEFACARNSPVPAVFGDCSVIWGRIWMPQP